MATSNSYDFALTRDQLIDLAYQHIGVVGEGASASANQVTEASRLLNMIVKLRAADGMPLWAMKRGYILPITGQSYVETDSHVVTAYDRTTFGAAEAANQTTLTVTSSADMTASDQIGLELDNGDMQWTTISSVTNATTIVIATGLTSAAASGNRIYSYTAASQRIEKPLRIIEADILDISSNNSTEIDVLSMSEYWEISGRTSEGVPNAIAYDQVSNSATNLDDGRIYFYPRFANGDYVIEFTYHRPFQDFDASTDNPDFPQAFYLSLMLELAYLLSGKSSIPLDERQFLRSMAKDYREQALQTVYSEGSMQIEPEWDR